QALAASIGRDQLDPPDALVLVPLDAALEGPWQDGRLTERKQDEVVWGETHAHERRDGVRRARAGELAVPTVVDEGEVRPVAGQVGHGHAAGRVEGVQADALAALAHDVDRRAHAIVAGPEVHGAGVV